MRTIVKIQVPLATTGSHPQCLVYNEDHSVETMMPYDGTMMNLMKGRFKAFFRADFVGSDLSILGEVADPGW